ncbi:MAG: histidine phosphatase family protein [Deltaproteobacteria bacterium]|nr:histidine phosphatase family protein [Deltaproteobacteria bacterium]MBW2063786.1 histidine phosphatase family protein [Deltaproteobacteria bacterium]
MDEGRFPVTTYGLLRHSKSRWNQEKRIQGQMDSPLTRTGREEAERWGKFLVRFKWDRIMSSDTGRTLETVDIINNFLKIPVHADRRLREQDWGRWTGRTIAEIRTQEPDLLEEQVDSGWGFCPPGGEDRLAVLKRSLESIRAASDKWAGEKILVITHEGVIKCLLYRCLGRRFLPTEPSILRSGRLHWIIYGNGGMSAGEINVPATG